MPTLHGELFSGDEVSEPVASPRRRDDAARAAWLYFIAGRTQDEIARQLDLSRQAVQRLVAFAVAEKLIKFRLDHPIAACMELADRLCARFDLEFADVMPGDPGAPGLVTGVAAAAAERLDRLLATRAPVVLCLGTGRTMRATVEQLPERDRPQHKIVSLVGSMAAGGPASPYDVVMRLGDKVQAERYPMPAPPVTDTVADREALQKQRAFRVISDLRDRAAASFVGIGEIGWRAPMHVDGFLSDADVADLVNAGAVGEITGWPFDAQGKLLQTASTERVASLALEVPPRRSTVVAGCGPQKVAPLQAALTGRLATAVVTDEPTALAVLST